MVKLLLFFTPLLFLIAPIAYAQQDPYKPVHINVPITLDGKLDEPEWQQAEVISDFMESDPNPGAPPTKKTEARILYDDQYLYVGITAYEPQPKNLVKTALERDFAISQDDETAFILDTYRDKSTGIIFVSNTLGARWDAQMWGDGSNQNISYNTYWDVATAIDSLGYTTEYRIPFSSLRFEPKPIVTMGFRISRVIKAENELNTYPKTNPKIQNLWDNVSFARQIIFYNLKTRRPIYITPYVIANYYEQNTLNAAGTGYDNSSQFMTRKNFVSDATFDKILSNIGVDAKCGLAKNLTLDLTVNTDFAQTEVDDIIINLTKYAVNLPEKRNFFLECSKNLLYSFNTGNDLFVSRNIGIEKGIVVPIIGGVRLTGNAGRWQLGVLEMQTASVSSDSIDPHNFFVFRTRHYIDSLGSFIGGMFENRSNTDGNQLSNQALGLDIVKTINPTLSLSGGIAATSMNTDLKGIGNSMYYSAAIFRNTNKGVTLNLAADIVGENFNPVMGYLDEPNHGLITNTLGYTWVASKTSAAEYFYLFTHENYRWYLSDGNQETVSADIYPEVGFKSGADIRFSLFEYKIDTLTYDWSLDPNNAIEHGTYKTWNNTVILTSPQKSVYVAKITGSYGGFYGGEHLFISPTITYAITKNLNVGVTYEYNHITFPKYLTEDRSTLYESHLLRVNLACLLLTKFSVKLYTQYDNIGHLISSNLRLRYNPREGTDLYLVFNQGLNTDLNNFNPHLPQINTQEFTIKFSRTFGE